eukprot:gene9606-7518_t
MNTTVQQTTQSKRASLDSSCLSKRPVMDFCQESLNQCKKRRSIDVGATSVNQKTAPPTMPWAAYQMHIMGAMGSGMPSMMGGLCNGMMPFCMPPPFIPPFMMPTAMAMWQAAVQQAAANAPCVASTTGASSPAETNAPNTCMPNSFQAPCLFTPFVPEASVATKTVVKSQAPVVNKSKQSQADVESKIPDASLITASSAPLSSSSVFNKDILEQNDGFDAMLDTFLSGESDDSGPFLLGGTNYALSASFGSELDRMGDDLSELSGCCKPLDLKLSNNDSHLDLLGLDLNLEASVLDFDF